MFNAYRFGWNKVEFVECLSSKIKRVVYLGFATGIEKFIAADVGWWDDIHP